MATAMLEWIVLGFRPLQLVADVDSGARALLLAPAAFLSEDITCIGAGLLVANGDVLYAAAVASCFIGILTANLALYGLGRVLGLAVFERAPLKWICHRRDIERYARWFNRNGARVIYITRCIPGTRLPTCVAAGMLKFPFAQFTFYQAVALLLWVPALVGGASLAGDAILPLLAGFRRYALPIALLLALLLLAIIKGLVPLAGQRGRCLVRARLRRLTGWMYWPRWLFYTPLVLYTAGLRLRYRAWTCTVCNPAVPASGFTGESKTHVLDLLREGGAPVAACTRLSRKLSAEARVRAAAGFMATQGLSYPVVLKPDIGRNGRGVRIVRTPDELERFLAPARPVDVMIQAYVPGAEFDVFLAHEPGCDQARILSITRLRPLAVTGDGRRTLDELILDNPDAACRYRMLARRFHHRLHDVPEAGHRVYLSELGSFRRGAVFEDGRARIGPECTAELLRLIRDIPGINFGRFNIRLCQDDDWAAGKPYRIIEFDGLTSVASHLYQRGTGPLTAWRTLARQWRLAFEIGAWHVAAGVEPWPLQDVLKLYSASRDLNTLGRAVHWPRGPRGEQHEREQADRP